MALERTNPRSATQPLIEPLALWAFPPRPISGSRTWFVISTRHRLAGQSITSIWVALHCIWRYASCPDHNPKWKSQVPPGNNSSTTRLVHHRHRISFFFNYSAVGFMVGWSNKVCWKLSRSSLRHALVVAFRTTSFYCSRETRWTVCPTSVLFARRFYHSF